MASIKLSPVELEILESAEFLWDDGVLKNAPFIFTKCENDERIARFVQECEDHIRDPCNCSFKWNNEVHNFGGDVFSYVCIFKSPMLEEILKVALNIEYQRDKRIVIGFMNISSKREALKLHKETA